MTTTVEPVSLVIGATGLLGSAVGRELGRDAAGPAPYPWSEPDALRAAFRSGIEGLYARAEDSGRPWTIYWCAGRGHVSAGTDVFDADEAALRALTEVMAGTGSPAEGVLCYASSAGAVYAGATTIPATEETAPSPMGDYGRSKLRQEDLVTEAVRSSPRTRAVLARISNLYGPGQRSGKPQGLITHLVLNTLRRNPTNIYVPLDTSRDYLHTRSAARMIRRSSRRALARPAGTTSIRLVAAERTRSISQVIGAVARVLKRRVPFVVAERPEARLQPAVLSFRSLDRDSHLLDTITLEEGLASLIADIRERGARGL